MVKITQFSISSLYPWLEYDSRNYLIKGFEKINFIFGDNGVGKTTFVNILKYLGKENSIGQKFINDGKESYSYYERIENNLDKCNFYNYNLDKIKQRSFKGRIFVFDDVFVNDNIFVVSSNLKDSQFARERKDKIEVVLQGGLKKLYDEMKDLKETKKSKDLDKKQKENEIEQEKKQLSSINEQLEDLENVNFLKEGENLDNLNKEKNDIKQKIEEITENIKEYEDKVLEIEQIEKKKVNLENSKKELKEIKNKIDSLKDKLSKLDDLKKFYEKYGEKITKFLNLGFELWQKDKDICPFCQTKINNDKKMKLENIYDKIKTDFIKINSILKSLEDEYNLKINEIKKLENELKTKENILDNKNCFIRKLDDLKLEKENLNRKLGEIENKITHYEEYKKIDKNKEKLANTKIELERSIGKLNKELEKLDKDITEITQKMNDIYKQITEKEKQFTKDFEAKINNYLKKLGFKDFKLKISGTKTKLNMEIKRQNHGGKIVSLSEGEKRALGLAFFLVLLENVDKNILKESIIIFDDPITSLDGKRRKATEELLNELFWQENPKFKVDQIFIFTHDKIFFKYLSKTKVKLKKGDKFIGIIYKVGHQKNNTAGSYLVSYDFKETYNSFLEKLKKIESGNIEVGEDYFALLVEGLHKLRFCIEYFIREEIFEYDNFEKVGIFIENISAISNKVLIAKEDIDNLSNLYDFCNKTGIHYEDAKIQPTLEELKEKIRLFLTIREKVG